VPNRNAPESKKAANFMNKHQQRISIRNKKSLAQWAQESHVA
jgi:hypothetical protein